MNKPLILVVEDDAPIRNLISTTLKAHDYRYTVADCGETALREASTSSPDILLLDLGLPDLDGRGGDPPGAQLVGHAHHCHQCPAARTPTRSKRWTPVPTTT